MLHFFFDYQAAIKMKISLHGLYVVSALLSDSV